MFGLEILVYVAGKKQKEFQQAIALLSPKQQTEFEGQQVFRDEDEPNHFLIQLTWSDRAALEEYEASIPFRTLMGAIKVLGDLLDLRVIEYDPLPGSSTNDNVP